MQPIENQQQAILTISTKPVVSKKSSLVKA